MTKKLKLIIVIASSALMVLYWLALAVTNTKYKYINYWWQALMSAAALTYGVLGLYSAKQWSWLKSGVGKSVFFISVGLILWGLGQAAWTYFVLKDPSQQSPNTHIMDFLYFSALPFWSYGIFKLSKASGARYGIRTARAKILVAVLTVVMLIVSYIVLVNIARGGLSYFHQGTSYWTIFYDLGYAAGDVVNLILALAIFGLSWRYLGGRFKRPILVILLAFVFLYMADFWYSYRNALGSYYNGDWVDLLYSLTVSTFGLGLCLLDPRSSKLSPAQQESANPQVPPVPVMPAEPVALPSTFSANSAPVDSPPADTSPLASSQPSPEQQAPASPGNGSI